MSAFVCNDYHVSVLATYASRLRYLTPHVGKKPERIAEVLYAENVKSVNHRYNENEQTDGFIFDKRALAVILSPVEAIKAAKCLDYQSCEHPGWNASEAKKIVDAIIDESISRLNGYDTAAWCIEPPAPAKPAMSNEAETMQGFDMLRELYGCRLKETKDMDVAQLAKEMRKDIKAAVNDGFLPEGLKVSVTVQRYSGGQAIDMSIKEFPAGWQVFSPAYLKAIKSGNWESAADCGGAYSDETNTVLQTLKVIHNAYNYDRSDLMTDYFDTRYYGSVEIDWELRDELTSAA